MINNGVAGQAGFDLAEDPIFRESGEDESVYPYINLIAAKAEDNEVYKKLLSFIKNLILRK
ncbi:MAG TPA: hypothetical protein GXZ58_10715 [Bacilli bacterium]|nr:hypothetical protein [Bacilli bacterium]